MQLTFLGNRYCHKIPSLVLFCQAIHQFRAEFRERLPASALTWLSVVDARSTAGRPRLS